tara:strand:- start:756 stop:5207 length:4452 start_codon:yes stop_codon:yes gene_type:complete
MLDLPDKFKKGIDNNNTIIYPFIIIGSDTDTPIYISTIKEIIFDYSGNPQQFKDCNLTVSSIKESVDIEKRFFKIANLSLSLNNFELNNTRISDDIIDKTNKEVMVFYKTQFSTSYDESLLIYRGILKRAEYNKINIKIVLEDKSDILLQRDIPTANLGLTRNILNKDYAGKPIPFTYGAVEKAPVIPWLDIIDITGRTSITIIPDDIDTITGSSRGVKISGFGTNGSVAELTYETGDNRESYLHIYQGDYYRVLQNYNPSVSYDGQDIFPSPEQYTLNEDGQGLTIVKNFSGSFPRNPPAFNEFHTVKLLRPNQAELVSSEGGVAESLNVSQIINIESSILRPEASVDSEDNPTLFISSGNETEFSTYTEIPNNQLTIEDVEPVDWINVNMFSIFPTGNELEGTFYPNEDNQNDYVDRTNYVYLMNAWLQTNAHLLGIKFVNVPPANQIIEDTKIRVWKHIGFILENGEANPEWDENIVPWLPPSESAPFEWFKGWCVPQWDASDSFRAKFISACTNTGDETDPVPFANGTTWDYAYWGSTSTAGNQGIGATPGENTKASMRGVYQGPVGMGAQASGPVMYNNSKVFSDPDKSTYYPSTIFRLNANWALAGTDNVSHSAVYVGQWVETTMAGALEEDEIFINIFNDGNPDIPYLYEFDDVAVFTPDKLKARYNPSYSDDFISTKYRSQWNGVEIGTLKGAPYEFTGSSAIQGGNGWGKFGGQWGLGAKMYDEETDDWGHRAGYVIGQNEVCGNNAWFMFCEFEIPKVLSLLSSSVSADLGEFVDENCNASVKAGSLIACAMKFDHVLLGANFNYDFIESVHVDKCVLRAGNASDTAEERLSVFYPFSNIASGNYLENSTDTFVYGYLDLNIPAYEETDTDGDGTGDWAIHSSDSNDDILVQAYATQAIDQSVFNYNSEFVGESTYGVNLLNISGSESCFQSGGAAETFNWHSFEAFSDDDSVESFNKYRIADWVNPNQFDSLALVYRIRNDNENTSSYVSMTTHINTIGLLQYTVNTDVFSGDLYGDILGRIDRNDGYYTGSANKLLENPADIIYHILETELEAVNIVDMDSLLKARSRHADIKFGFSVKDKIGSKELLEKISLNTMLFPKFNSEGLLSFTSISNQYNSSDKTIEQKDVLDFTFSRTKSENIKTLVNVKYKKDYATNEYTRETGYCDGYDFFGNGENNREVFKKINGTEQWTNRGYNYNLLGLKREDNIFEFESDFIRDYDTAIALRNFIYLFNCNQHTIIECTLPLKYINLEVGDIVDFDYLHSNLKAFGEDYSKSNDSTVIRNGQEIYPYFIITSTIKSSKNIKVKCMQMHKLERDFSAGKGSLSRRSILGLSHYETLPSDQWDIINSHITTDDLDMYGDIISGLDNYLTLGQKLSADINLDGTIDQEDLNTIELVLSGSGLIGDLNQDGPVIGDLNQDGIVNVIDIVSLVSYILGDQSPGTNELLAADLNEDGILNVQDIVALVAEVLN